MRVLSGGTAKTGGFVQLCFAVQCSAVQCSAAQYSETVQYSAVQYSAVQCSTVRYSEGQCSTLQYSAVQCSTVHYTRSPPIILSVGPQTVLFSAWSVFVRSPRVKKNKKKQQKTDKRACKKWEVPHEMQFVRFQSK